ncbi:hypothetical protein Glove_350g129 [Diversispora epigaea]|uniref:Uncharacterized protein n=1 Tax=Diversispora epigaea TaxID=1348612 RepID=A0A397HCY5_9GLOM|nr:hypothetical protein Glove_350g129 [Diversispora epigaea]
MSSVSQNMLPDFISFSENRKLKEEIAKLKRQNSQMEIDFEKKLEKSQENINQMKEEIDFLANINQQFIRFSLGDSSTEFEIILSKCPKGRKLKSKKITKTNKGKRVFGNDSEEDTESDNEKNEKDTKNEMKTIIKTINSKFNLNYSQTFTSANNCEIRCKLIPELQKSLTPKFRPSVTQLTKWLNSIHKSQQAIARMRNSGKLPKDLCRVHVNNRQNDKKFHHIKAAKELFRKNDPNITDYDKESLLRILTDRAFHLPEMPDTDEEDHLKTVVNVYDLSWRSAELKHLLRNVLDLQSALSTTAQLQRKRNYSDEIQQYDFPLWRKPLIGHLQVTTNYSTAWPTATGQETHPEEAKTPHCQYYKKDHTYDPGLKTLNYYQEKKGIKDTKSQKSFASAHIEKLLPYCSCKVYPPALAEIVRSSAHIPNLLPYHSYKVAVADAKNLARSRSLDLKEVVPVDKVAKVETNLEGYNNST